MNVNIDIYETILIQLGAIESAALNTIRRPTAKELTEEREPSRTIRYRADARLEEMARDVNAAANLLRKHFVTARELLAGE